MAVLHGKGNYCFVSGADEKVARVFEAPLSFLKTLNNATLQKSCSSHDILGNVQILGANMFGFGLSQKPIYVQAAHEIPERSGIDGMDTLEIFPTPTLILSYLISTKPSIVTQSLSVKSNTLT